MNVECGATPDRRRYGATITAPCHQMIGHTGCHVSTTSTGATGWHHAGRRSTAPVGLDDGAAFALASILSRFDDGARFDVELVERETLDRTNVERGRLPRMTAL